MLHYRMDTKSPRVPATQLLAVVGTIIGASEPASLQRGAAVRLGRSSHDTQIFDSCVAAMACIGLGGNNASASTVCLNAIHGATNYGPDTSCTTSGESEVFLQSQTER
jgi:hypothetical protein